MEQLAKQFAAIPGVVAVTLGGSRATNTAVEGSDWDFRLYYRGTINPADIVALGWPGRVFAPGDWGRIVNGGAWLTIGGIQDRLGCPEWSLDSLVSDVRARLGLRDDVWVDQ